MPPRVVAFFLAFVLLCSGFAVPEQAIAAATQNAEQAHDRTLGDAWHHDHDGSIDDDRADDLPTQPNTESAQDPLLLEGPCAAAEPALTSTRAHRFGLAALQPPFLEGPQRPPCLTHVLA